ncbi:acyl-CoA dehydrogenase family protein [Fulvimonas soli]|jgi:alkylation response protein AidB-like acyl-CoA dehydrogenase|uniref:Alkylation response protein AidB-like acyl-CoA dehydrogenase n=1 Tax=Fulvimonas soli TaxID=155197 RepID=A0A316IN42_9GAMM|nr:acyl-CoA dehydrogenase family protein [Fulvimonas soli]PWK91908.1 alkylation response protein AidB-like acyl-CoA dehydrogenase [Fulvimonas soli]TNY26035.1 acyl-CoA dehydrogenase [Fulvimonas soli]
MSSASALLEPRTAVPAEDALERYRLDARAWLAEHAPRFSGAVRRGLPLERDVALGRAWQALKAAHGYGAITLPKRYGGGGGTELQKIVFTEEELRYDLPVAYFSISLSNPVPIFLRHAPETFRQRLGPPAIRGEHIWCQLFSEPAAGSDLAALRLRAERQGDGWVLNGQKLWTSWAQIAQWGVIVTRTDPDVPKHAGLTYFFLDMRSPGISVRPIRRLVGHPDLNEVYFDNVYVPDEQRLGEVGGGFRVAIETLMIERYGITDETASSPALEALVELARRARLNGRPALADGEVRAAIARAYVERQGLRSIQKRAMEAIAAGREPGPEGAIRKLLLGRMRQQLGALALDLMGADGIRLDPQGESSRDFAHAWLDPSVRIAGGTDEVLLNTLAERVLGLPQDHRPDKGVPFRQLES